MRTLLAVALLLALVPPTLAQAEPPLVAVAPGVGEDYIVITQDGTILVYHESNGCPDLQRAGTDEARLCGRHDRFDVIFGAEDAEFRRIEDPAGAFDAVEDMG